MSFQRERPQLLETARASDRASAADRKEALSPKRSGAGTCSNLSELLAAGSSYMPRVRGVPISRPAVVRSAVPEPHRRPHHHVHAADRGARDDLEFARGIPRLDGGDEALRTSAFPAFINVVHETRLVPLSTSKAHRPIAFLAIGLFGKRSWRGDGPLHHGALR
jgi:hypothetical protein